MKISTKGRYAVRLMVDLAQNDNGGNISLKDIAKRQNLSLKYLEQIITVLTRAGYVISTRGSNGGYRLTHKPEYYTVGMILRLTEGSLAPVSCLEHEENDCPRAESCMTLYVWKGLYECVTNYLDNITLQDIIDHSAAVGGDEYCI